jgi:hypothetical protein
MALSLEKKQEIVRLSLEKRNVPTDIVMAVKLVLDVSGSIKWLFDNGTMQELVDRLIPVGMRFDDNGALEAYAFGSNVESVEDIVAKDFGSYVNKKFLKQVSRGNLWSGTEYGIALEKVKEDWEEVIAGPTASQTGLIGSFKSLFGKKPAPVEKPKQAPAFLMFITDGDDQGSAVEAEAHIRDLGAMNMYIQLIGVGNSKFAFLRKMADKYDHVGFVTFPDLANISDEFMYGTLLNDELCDWIKTR